MYHTAARSWLVLAIAAVAIVKGPLAVEPVVAAPQEIKKTQTRIGINNGALPAFFVERGGGFILQARDMSARFHSRAVDYSWRGTSIYQRFEDAAEVAPRGINLTGKVNYLIGNDPKSWERGLAAYASVGYKGLYSNIDLTFRTEEGRLKSEFVVMPGADPSRIAWRYQGIQKVMVDPDGSLRVYTSHGELSELAPVLYQVIEERRVPVEGGFAVEQDRVSYRIGSYDRTRPVVIDPTIAYSSYIGGSRNESATAVAVDSAGFAYVTGWSESANFPLASPYRGYSGSVDAFVMKFNTSGTALVYATYLGGSGEDRSYSISVDAYGSPHITGFTTSTNFPVLVGSRIGLRDAFLTRLHPNGSSLLYSVYLGGTGNDTGTGVVVDPYGQIYLAGETDSPDLPTHLPFQSSLSGRRDAFLLKVGISTATVFSTYFGGSGDERVTGVALTPDTLTPYMTGCTNSTDFPLRNPWQAMLSGGQDAFVTRFNSDANDLVYSTYLGGSSSTECATAIALDAYHNAYITGSTTSPNFPVLGPFQSQSAGGTDAFVSKLNSGGLLLYSSYLGGRGVDAGTAVQVDINRRAYVVGYTASRNFPIVAPTQGSLAGSHDAFAVRVDVNGNQLNFSTYLGGTASDSALGAAYHSNGDLYVVGSTSSLNFPVVNPFRPTNAGFLDAFIAKIAGAGF